MKNPLVTTGIILNLNVRKWSGEVSDKKALRAVAEHFKSDTHNDIYRKSLFVNDPLALVDRVAGRIRNHYYAKTSPWMPDGQGRLIPSQGFQAYAAEYSPMKMEFYQEVDKFLDAYPEHIELAKERKGDLFMASEYPQIESVRNKFEIQLSTLPFPDINDFRIDAPEEVIQELERSMKESVARVQDIISVEINIRFVKRLEMLIKTLTIGKRFHTSLLTELLEVCNMADQLKETVDPALLVRMSTAKNTILCWSPLKIRNSETLQLEIIDIRRNLL